MDHKIGDLIGGFRLSRINDIKEYASKGLLLEHEASGCKAYHLSNDDKENLFAFVFRTPPSDNTGAAHILEHAVLSGSRGFSVKDPFIALMKGSVNTFLNAMTYPDKTVFPAASTVEKDYFNLLRVYGDSVFFPLLKKEIFHQEGRRFVLNEAGELEVDGVVFNEMKGNYSNHESIVGEWSYRSLFPESPYRFDSGGEPQAIVDLTYQDFLDLHALWYHPSNCQIFLYGNIPTEKSLGFIDENFLSEFTRKEIDTSIPFQPPFSSPMELVLSSPLAKDDSPDGKATVTLNWIVGNIDDAYRVLCLEVLSEILLGNSGSPMQKAIVESGLGEDLSPVSGLDTDTRELVFSFGIRGTDLERIKPFEELVLSELSKLAEKGLPSDAITGALRRVEFRNREIRGGVPFGLRLMGKTLRGWLHGKDPETSLEFSPWMEKLKKDAAADGFFEKFITSIFLKNSQRSIVTILPSHEHEEKEQSEFSEWKKSRLEAMGPDEKAALEKDDEAFEDFQEEPDSAEDLSKIPCLSIEDIPRKVEAIDTFSGDISGVPFYSLDVFTNGIVYVDLAFDIQDLAGDYLHLFPFFCRAAAAAGLPGMPYDEVAQQLAIKTGGFSSFLEVNSVDGYDELASGDGRRRSRAFVVFRLKTLETSFGEAMDLAARLIQSADFSDRARMKDLFLEFRNDVKAQILPSGSSFTSLRAGAHLSPVFAREEQWKGIEQVRFLYDTAADIDARIDGICADLERMRRLFLAKARLTINLTAHSKIHGEAERTFGSFIDTLPDGESGNFIFELPANLNGLRAESIVLPSAVNFASTVLPASSFVSSEHAHEVVVAQMLKTNYLWEHVRMRGGAYGVSSSVNGGEMLFSFSSYRDPNITSTLETYKNALDWIAKGEVDPGELEKAVITIIGRDIRPLSPGEKGLIGYRRKLYKISDEFRQKKRDELLSTAPADVRAAAERLRAGFDDSYSVVLGGEDAVAALPDSLSGFKENRIELR